MESNQVYIIYILTKKVNWQKYCIQSVHNKIRVYPRNNWHRCFFPERYFLTFLLHSCYHDAQHACGSYSIFTLLDLCHPSCGVYWKLTDPKFLSRTHYTIWSVYFTLSSYYTRLYVGSHVMVKQLCICCHKNDLTHTIMGIFFGFTLPCCIAWFEDHTTRKFKRAWLVVFWWGALFSW